jgi:mono/diheme cytochrome c family protein
MNRFAGGATVALAVLALLPEARPLDEQSAKEKAFQEQVKPYLKQYCAGCHNGRVKTAGIAVDVLNDAASLQAHGDTWEKILRKIRTGEMPPKGLPRAAQDKSDALLAWLGGELDREAERNPDPGRITIHRLNRAEYNNAVRDLLAVDFRPADDFPADDSGYGFDNIADVLSVPPVLLEKYLRAADKVSRMALGRMKFDAVLERENSPRDVPQNARISETAPVGSRGGMEFEHKFPAEAEYLLRVRLRGTPDPRVPEILDFRLDGKLLRRVEVQFQSGDEDEDLRRFELRIPVRAGRHRILATFLRDDSKNENPRVEFGPKGVARRNQLGVDWVEIGGPFNVKGPGDLESRSRLLTCRTDSETCAASILKRVARRAWRRPVTAEETSRLLKLYRMGREDSKEFEGGIELALKAVLVSPNFLFRIEQDPVGAKPQSSIAVSDLDLASRLSFFLWSSIPDEALLSAAERGELKQPAVLAAQVRRMVADPKARALTENFAGQWLHLRNLASWRPDPTLFPTVDDGLRAAMMRETELFFEAVLKEDRNVTDFLDARFTFLNERLAQFYGIPGVEGRKFRRVELTSGERGGVLTMGSVLAVTSYPTRTSPVIRGKWVLENLLGAPPPPPPPDVPALKEAGLGKTVSMRQQLEAHRANPSCGACHSKMDPIGFALENYDAIGRFRAKDGDFAVDASGQMPSGASFQNATELKKILSENPREFVLCFTEKMLTYALGRGVERTDKPIIRAIERDAAKDGYRMSSILLGIVNSAPFRMRRVSEVTRQEKQARPHVAD